MNSDPTRRATGAHFERTIARIVIVGMTQSLAVTVWSEA